MSAGDAAAAEDSHRLGGDAGCRGRRGAADTNQRTARDGKRVFVAVKASLGHGGTAGYHYTSAHSKGRVGVDAIIVSTHGKHVAAGDGQCLRRVDAVVVAVGHDVSAGDVEGRLALDSFRTFTARAAHHNGAALQIHRLITLDTLGRGVEVAISILLASGNHLDSSVVHGQGLVGADALAAGSSALAIECAAVHHEDAVGLHASTSAHVVLVGVIFAGACGQSRSSSSVYLHQSVAAQSLAGRSRSLHIDHSTFYIDGIVALDGVASRGLHINVVARAEHHVVVAPYTRLAVAVDIERTLAREEHLAFAEEAGFHILVVGGIAILGAVCKGVISSVGKHDIGTFLTLQIDGGTIGIGNSHAVELQLILLVAIDFEESIRGSSAHSITYVLYRRLDNDISPVDGDSYAVHTSRGARLITIEGNINVTRKGVVLDVVFRLIALAGDGLCLGKHRLVDGDIERGEVAERTVIGCSAARRTSASRVASVVGICTVLLPGGFQVRIGRASRCQSHGSQQHRHAHNLLGHFFRSHKPLH